MPAEENHALLREAKAIIEKLEPCPGMTAEDIQSIIWQLLTLMGRVKAHKLATNLPLSRQKSGSKKRAKRSSSNR